MKPKLLIQIAAGCLLFFAVGHSIGHTTRKSVEDPKAQEVIRAMSENKFDMFGTLRSYDENYHGMSLNLIFALLAFSLILFMVASETKDRRLLSRLLVPIMLCTGAFAYTGFFYFFIVPAVTCLVAFLLLLVAWWRLRREVE